MGTGDLYLNPSTTTLHPIGASLDPNQRLMGYTTSTALAGAAAGTVPASGSAHAAGGSDRPNTNEVRAMIDEAIRQTVTRLSANHEAALAQLRGEFNALQRPHDLFLAEVTDLRNRLNWIALQLDEARRHEAVVDTAGYRLLADVRQLDADCRAMEAMSLSSGDAGALPPRPPRPPVRWLTDLTMNMARGLTLHNAATELEDRVHKR